MRYVVRIFAPTLLALVLTPGCVGRILEPDPGGDDGDPSVDNVARQSLRRLSQYEYDNTLRDLLGDDTRPSAQLLPNDQRTPYDNDYTLQAPTQALVDGVDLLAADAAARLLLDPERTAAVVGCEPDRPGDDECFRRFVTSFGRRAFRRPLSEDEVERYTAMLDYSVEDGDFYTGVAGVLRAMLQDPHVLYLIEIGTPVPGRPDLFALNDWEVATRLSYFLWGSTPNDWLLDVASDGGLQTRDQVRAAAELMLEDPRALDRFARFHAMWIGYEILPHAPSLANAMRRETTALVQRVVFEERVPWQELFRSRHTYLDDALAAHYGLPQPGSEDPVWVDYGDSGRRGLLSHGSFLSIGAKFEDTSPTVRGLMIRTRLFCQDIPDPPPDVDPDQPPPGAEDAVCKSDRYQAILDSGCAGCHAQMDPIGFGLESYDAQGRFRDYEPGLPECPIDGVGELVGVGTFRGPGELADLMLGTGRVNECAITNLYRYAIGRYELDATDRRFIDALVQSVGPGDFRFDELLASFVSADAFRYRRLEEQD